MPQTSRSGSIDRQTRIEIKDLLLRGRYRWNGVLSEAEFLSELYDLDHLGTAGWNPGRTTAYQEIEKKGASGFADWSEGWVFGDSRFELLGGSDQNFLRFLTQTVHARVRPDPNTRKSLVKKLNELLAPNYELVETTGRGGSTQYTVRDGSGYHHPRPVALAVDRAELGAPETLQQHLKRIEGSIATDPEAAIGSCKELVESVMAQILDARGEAVGASDSLTKTLKNVVRSLGIDTGAVSGDARASAAIAGIVRGLAATIQSVGELRNSAGTGHGRASTPAVTRIHARLAFNAAVTVTEYLFGEWEGFNA